MKSRVFCELARAARAQHHSWVSSVAEIRCLGSGGWQPAWVLAGPAPSEGRAGGGGPPATAEQR